MKQTIKYKLKTSIEQEKHLSNLCFYATKLYNTDNYQRRKTWEDTGKIPNAYSQKKILKDNHFKEIVRWLFTLPSAIATKRSKMDTAEIYQKAIKLWGKEA